MCALSHLPSMHSALLRCQVQRSLASECSVRNYLTPYRHEEQYDYCRLVFTWLSLATFMETWSLHKVWIGDLLVFHPWFHDRVDSSFQPVSGF